MNLAAPLREALLGMPDITDRLGTYVAEPSIFTRRPVPSGATYPAIVIPPDVFIGDEDGLTSSRPVISRDIAVYAQLTRQMDDQQIDGYREVETLGYALRDAFHRRKDVLVVEGFHVIDIVAIGPIVAPASDERMIGRVVSLTIRLCKLS